MGLGISADTLRGITQLAGASVQVAIAEAIEAIDSGEYATNQATLSVYAEGCRAVVEGMRASGHRARLLGAALEGLEAAEAAGLGDLGIYAAAQVTSS
jgi:hypothetical protein